MVYRVSQLTFALGRPRIKVPYFAMVNLVAGEKIVPELVQGDFTAERVVSRLREILVDSPARSAMLEGLARVRERLRNSDGEHSAADRAADAVLALASHNVSSQSA
jgi:lipid-A-disaccharide synthase